MNDYDGHHAEMMALDRQWSRRYVRDRAEADQRLARAQHDRDRARAWACLLEQLLALAQERAAMLEDELQRVTVQRDELSGPPWW